MGCTSHKLFFDISKGEHASKMGDSGIEEISPRGKIIRDLE
jgi:hypothetical protein